MNKLQKAAEVLKTSWCAGAFRRNEADGFKYCSLGAMYQVNGIWDISVNDGESPLYTYGRIEAETKVEESTEVRILAETISEHYPSAGNASDLYSDYTDIIVNFNDHIAGSSEEVVTMFEKAAIKFDEIV